LALEKKVLQHRALNTDEDLNDFGGCTQEKGLERMPKNKQQGRSNVVTRI